MATDRIDMPTTDDNLLGAYLRDRRAKLDPAAFGFSASRRRTPGLRREEVAQRANVSATWYTWLEQGRGGAPSADVLDRLARALELNAVEREHLFLLAQHRPPEVEAREAPSVSPRLQRMLDAMESSPAYIKTSTWDVVAWNRAAASILVDYSTLPPGERNILRRMFDPASRAHLPHWENDVRGAVAAARIEAARAGTTSRLHKLVEELSASSAEFARMWNDNDVRNPGEGSKVMHHPVVGDVTLDYSTFAVDGEPDLGLVIFTPRTPEDGDRMKQVIAMKSPIVRAAE
ncbi:MAG TPA: helix-turn-helix transcriptional regulator [Polyangiaceae bacterium]